MFSRESFNVIFMDTPKLFQQLDYQGIATGFWELKSSMILLTLMLLNQSRNKLLTMELWTG